MPENPTTALVKTANSPALARVSNQLALTDKLLTKPEEPFLIPYRKGNKWGFCDREKNIIFDCVWDFPTFFNGNLRIVRYFNDYHIYNRSGDKIWSVYDSDAFLTSGLAAIMEFGEWGFINDKGVAITPFKYNDVGSFHEGLAIVKFDNKIGIVNLKGEVVVEFRNNQYDEIEPFGDGLARVRKNDKYGFINRKGEEVIPLTFDDVGWLLRTYRKLFRRYVQRQIK